MKQMEVDNQNVHVVIIEATCRITEIMIVWLGEEKDDQRTAISILIDHYITVVVDVDEESRYNCCNTALG